MLYDKSNVQTIRVETPSAKYDVIAGSGLIATLAQRIERIAGRLPRRVFVVTSPEIWALWGETLAASFSELPITLFLAPGEKHKTMASVEKLLRQMIAAGGDRGSLLIAFGGGIVGDVGGFLAAVFMRGIPYVQVPTTFLAQVDSSVGGKTGVNLPEGKNLVGSFHHPLAVFADIGVLGTLPDRELRAGLMESVKAGIIRDRALVRFLEEHVDDVLRRDPKALEKVIAASIRMKADVVNKDEREIRPAHDSQFRSYDRSRHRAGDSLQGVAPRGGRGVGYGGRALSRAPAWNDHHTPGGADGEPHLSLWSLAAAQTACRQTGLCYQCGQEERGRRTTLCTAGRYWRCGRGRGCDAGRTGSGGQVHAEPGR